MTCYRGVATVQKPYQYVGHEANTYRKDFDSNQVRFCIAFPDAYEIGMSNIGMQIIYHVMNEIEGVMADRVYAPLTDMGNMLRSSGQTLLGRESGRRLTEFDCVGFTLQYELCYTNVLYMLDLAKIPRRSHERRQGPLIAAGGPCTVNPEPVAAFFDFFVIGEGEEVSAELCYTLAVCKKKHMSRAEILAEIAKIPGIYVPKLYTPRYHPDGRFDQLYPESGAPRRVERRIVKDLDVVPYPNAPITAAIQPVHERLSVEIQRGCTRSCRFCQAGYIYRPRRERNPNNILEIVKNSIAATGIHDIGLLSLSSADYSHLHPLMKQILAAYQKERLSVQLPSTRLEALREEYLDVLKDERRSGFTIAPEAGSQRLRNVINKNFTKEEVVDTARMLFRNGWTKVKMYFMIGLPTETDADVRAISELANEVFQLTAEFSQRRKIIVSVSNFVPKAHTPFQWHRQISSEEIVRKLKLIKSHLAFKRNISFRNHNPDASFAEGLIARGDRRTADLIERAYELGSVYDCWQEKLNIDNWRQAISDIKSETGIDHEWLGMRERSLSERMPWHRIFSGLHPKFYKNELHKAMFGIATEDCSFDSCHECGLCHKENGVEPIVFKNPLPVKSIAKSTLDEVYPTRVFRFQYHKVEEGVFLSTLELQKMLVRAFIRAGIRVVMDNGFHPRPVIVMGPALALGIESRCEIFDISLQTGWEADPIVAKVRKHLPDHLSLMTGSQIAKNDRGINQLIKSISFRVSERELTQFSDVSLAAVDSNYQVLRSGREWQIQKTRLTRRGAKKSSTIELQASLESIERRDGYIYYTLAAPAGQTISPYFVVEALIGNADLARTLRLEKTGFQTR